MTYKDFLDSKIKKYETILEEFNSEHWVEEIALRKVFQSTTDYEESDFPEHRYEKKQKYLLELFF